MSKPRVEMRKCLQINQRIRIIGGSDGMDAEKAHPQAVVKKHPCPDCACCQWCSERRCQMCRGWLTRPAAQKEDEGKDEDKNETRKGSDEGE